MIAAQLKEWAQSIKREVHAVYLAARDPETPWYAKALALFIAAYALSPIDLIPDFIPILGYLDDIILLPLGVMLVVRLVPPEVMARARAAARDTASKPTSHAGTVVIVSIWIAATAVILWLLWPELALSSRTTTHR